MDDLDMLARKNGFKNAAQMSAYYRKQQEMRSAPNKVIDGQGGQQGMSLPSSVQPAVQQGLSWHPAFLLKSILDKWNAATGG